MLLYISQCVDCCRGLYDGAAFTIGNAADGTTAPIRLRVGVFMGCPLSPHLFTAAIAPLLHALKRLPDTGVKLTGVDRPGAAAYADDLKTFSSSVDGVKRKHAVVVDFLRWTGMAANPSKCSTIKCPIPGNELWRYFDEVNTPQQVFDAEAPEGAGFREAMTLLTAATRSKELLTEAPTVDDIEDQLQRVRGSSSPGLDGVSYDVYKRFTAQLLPVLHAAFACCWQHKTVPQSWKVGVVRLLHKKGERLDPANWRPICLQQTIYKLYAGILSRKFVRWLDVNDRHADAQKGFRAMNGCGEHNFLAVTLVDHPRRKRKELHVVWGEGRLDKSQAKPRQGDKFQVQWLDTQYQNKAPHVLNGAISALSTKEKKNLIDDDVEEMEECMETFDPPMELPTTLAKAEAIANMHFEPGTQSEEPTDISRHPDGTTTTNLEPQSNSYLSI
ncbi:hypothetical protein PC115_g21917 [Phytophthora cactorum]|uniref:Reverse transcriptase domain-containing protein n=1 Tax=Phytophthora cactorum TaxID=29920 RepID=A0A8T1AH94_9STRA|nr:hypothetical protein PC115_g21917 [Phytophthora cactorum]